MFSLLPQRNIGKDASLPMFSEQDVRDIFEALPPLNATYPAGSVTLPDLVLTSSGGGFITAARLVDRFESMVTQGTSTYYLMNYHNNTNFSQRIADSLY